MKRKVILLISVLLVVVLSLSVLTACKDKDAKEESQDEPQEQVIPPYEWLDAITESMEYNLLSAGNGSFTIQNKAELNDFTPLTKINGVSLSSGNYCYLYKEDVDEVSGKTLLTLYSAEKDVILYNMADVEIYSDFTTLDKYCLVIKSENTEGIATFTLYDMYGNKITDIVRGSDVKDIVFTTSTKTIDNISYTVVKCEISYNAEDKENDVQEYYLKKSTFGNSWKYVEKPEEYKAIGVGGVVVDEDSLYPLTMSYESASYPLINYKGYTTEYLQNFAGDYLWVVYDASGAEVATTVIPSEVDDNWDYSFPLSDTSCIIITEEEVEEDDEYSYTYYDSDDDKDYFVKVGYYYCNLLTGTFNKIDFNYYVEDVYVDIDYEYNLEELYSSGIIGSQGLYISHKITVLEVYAFEDKEISDKAQFLVMNSDGTIKEDITPIISASKMTDDVTKIGDNKYLAENDNGTSYILDGRLNVLATLRFSIGDFGLDYIEGCISKNNESYWGVTDLDGKVVIPFEYEDIDINMSMVNYKTESIEATDFDGNEYIFTVNNGQLVKTALGEVYEGEKLVKYVGFYDQSIFAFTYENVVEKVVGKDETDVKYNVKSTIKDCSGNVLTIAYLGSYDLEENAIGALSSTPYISPVYYSISYNTSTMDYAILFAIGSQYREYNAESGWVEKSYAEFFKIAINGFFYGI